MSTARERLVAATKAKTTAQLMAAHREIEAGISGRSLRGPEYHVTVAVIADVLTERHDLDGELDRIFTDETFEGTYHEALEQAMKAKGVMLTHT